MKGGTHQFENSHEAMFLVTNVRSLKEEMKSANLVQKLPIRKPNLAINIPNSSNENESSKTKVQKQPHRESKLKAKTAMSKHEDNFSSESDTENGSNATKRNQNNLGKEPVKIGCPFCSTIMGAPSNMKQHILIHTGEKPFSCAFCELKTIQKSTLEKHMRRKHSQK